MKVGVIGCGSIGKRHIGNLIDLGHEVIAWNRGEDRREEVRNNFCIPVYSDLNKFLNTDVVAVMVCTPSSFHFEHSDAVISSGKHLFVEKPLSNTLDGLYQLEKKAKSVNLITHVGCNMRYHFGPSYIKGLLDDGCLGKPLWGSLWGGMRLLDWHPNEDHQKMYSAKECLGGGAVLDFIHEIDLSLWLFGEPIRLASMIKNSGSLGIETEDIVDVILTYSSNFQINLHLDYLQRPFQRGIRLVCENGWVNWDLGKEVVELYIYDQSQSKIIQYPNDWGHNNMYVQQLEHFFWCIQERKKSESDLVAGIKAVEIAMKIKSSAKNNVMEEIC
jgi:predicted dehydrogenase